jgi:vesicle-fusing ATPase
MIRELFQDAEDELRACNGDATKSALHLVVIDEIDAVFRRRGTSAGDSGEATRASAVNQILAKLDGINVLDNVLMIGMTNRKELLDPAVIRPGRLEVLVEIPLPDAEGRREILKIHFGPLRQAGRLSIPLCNAIDGKGTSSGYETRQASPLLPWRRKLDLRNRRVRDLAVDRFTRGLSGADLAGLVRCSGSIALARSRIQGDGDIQDLLITLEDVMLALEEVKR